MADRVGIKKMVLAGLVFYCAVFAGFAAASEAIHVWLLFCIYGVYKGMSDGSQRAYVAELAGPDVRGTSFGIFHTAVGLMVLPASIIGGVLWDSFGPQATFIYGASLSLISVIVFALPVVTRRKP